MPTWISQLTPSPTGVPSDPELDWFAANISEISDLLLGRNDIVLAYLDATRPSSGEADVALAFALLDSWDRRWRALEPPFRTRTGISVKTRELIDDALLYSEAYRARLGGTSRVRTQDANRLLSELTLSMCSYYVPAVGLLRVKGYAEAYLVSDSC